jgi:glycosyltransferase involved in cell wall biosynthesis
MAADVRFPLERANGVQIVKTAAALARQDVETTLVVRQSDPRPTDEILGLYGVTPSRALHVRRLRVLHRRGWSALPRAAFLARAVLLARAALARGETVFTRDLQLADALLRLPRRRGRVVYEAHAVESVMYRERGALYGRVEPVSEAKATRLRERERHVWRAADGFVATTAGIRDSFQELFGARGALAVVPNGCDVPADRTFPGLAAEDPPRVLYAGQLYPWKGVDVLVEAMASVPRAELVVVGGLTGEPDLERIRVLVQRLGLASRTRLLGTVPQAQVGAELARAAVVAVPFLHTAMTERHTSPLKAFEALAAGRPIVATDLPSSREVLRHEENALLVPPADPGALGLALRRVVDDRPLAERLARQAWDDAPLWSWDSRASKLKTLLEGLG